MVVGDVEVMWINIKKILKIVEQEIQIREKEIQKILV